MADPSTSVLEIKLPASVTPSNGTRNLQLKIVGDPKKGRAINRAFRDANGSDPGRRKRVEWEVGGIPIGASLESLAGGLGLDFAQNLEHRWPRRLISSIAQTAVDLTGDDPPGTASYFGTAYFGTSYFGSGIGGGSSGDGPDVVVFDEQNNYLFAERGIVSTQVNMLSTPWSLVSSVVLDSVIRDAAHWRAYNYLALGPTTPMQRRVGASSEGAMYEDTESASPTVGPVYTSAIKRGSDRAWYIDAEAGDSFNFAGFTLNDFADLALPFQVGDPLVPVNGIGPFGPFTGFGASDNIYTFTDQGKPVPLSKALDSIHSTVNGSQFADPGFGWNYYLSVAGLRAHDLSGNDNPIGIGERMRGFTGHNGICVAIFAARGELWAVWQTSAGNLYGYRGVYGPQTGATGQPSFFPWFYMAAQTCGAIFSSTTPNAGTQNLTIIRAAGTNLYHMTIAANGRDDLAATVYSTGGGVAYLTTLDRDVNLLKTFRLARFRTRSMTTGSSWALAMAFDPNPVATTTATYVAIGTATTNGAQTLTATAGGDDGQGNATPTANISGRTMKPRITQVAAGSGASSTPPEIDGTIEIEYDERPDQLEVIDMTVYLNAVGWTSNYTWQALLDLVGQNTDGPVAIQLPDDMPPGVSGNSGGGQKFAMLASVTNRRDSGENGEVCDVQLQVWPRASALT